MTTPHFIIPKEFQTKLRFVEAKDTRTDDEILESLTKHVPITSEKNVWSYWHSGVTNMPLWNCNNVIDWVRMLGPSWTVRVLDKVPNSPNHALAWLKPEELPESFTHDTMTGPYVGPHSADFLRGAALYDYGGVWCDVGCIMLRDFDRICWTQLADEESPFTISTPWMLNQHIANHFVAARKGDPFIKRWHELFMHFWKGRNDYSGIIESPLIGFVKDFNYAMSEARGFHWSFKVDPLVTLGYIGQVLSWIRIALLQEPDGFDGVEYAATKILLYDSLTECWMAEKTVGFKGQDFFDVLTTRLDADPESEEYKKAYRCVWTMLTEASMQKITHGKELVTEPACGALLDLPENKNRDYTGTFADLLRYGSVHFEQKRESIDYVKAIRPSEKHIIHKGLTEA
ncbi:hypothetical protein P154DRAFT_534871 [Amniculicola lignicola CBS 123094]|uniref:Capsule polysaccharide biosynthesis protein n=1 Tax=Amniculicola lignicola CBS 123094 TaxID=1392246 RepID=A0A6A5WEA4_9PLEO|nr:hypothetical protein P154DRAFT_534871 [Amniculicola lignicola CBS 123094]